MSKVHRIPLAGVALLLCAALLGGCGAPSATPAPAATPADTQAVQTEQAAAADTAAVAEYRKITARQAKDIMDAGNPYTLVDVRTSDEFNAGHIAGAVLIPSTEIQDRAAAELPDKNALILVYCRSGVRSAGAARALVGLGYTNVYDMGGIMDWTYGTVTG